ncbi:MAG TPA: hypothetical protein VHX65_17975 [Pirellulales bacterium]|nr:hypothetical protein [Pirellulales bacterium]
MIVSQSDIDSFHQFATRAISERGLGLSLEELLEQRHAEQEREETIESVRRGVEDADAGRVRSIAEVDKAIRDALGFPNRRQVSFRP